jgi:DNA polymerase III epsilon subunit
MKRQIVIDTETTGLDPIKGSHRVIEIALVEVVDNNITGRTFQSYCNPLGKKVTRNAFLVHKIKDSFLLDKPLFADCITEVINFIGDAELVFYNKAFDLKFLNSESQQANSKLDFSKDYKTTCLMKLVTDALNRKSDKLSLDDACRVYHVDNSERNIHGALIDATLTAKLLIELNTRSTLIGKIPHQNKAEPPEKFPFPRAYKGYQINYCKNPNCQNYGIPPMAPKKKDNGEYKKGIGAYKIQVIRSQRKGKATVKILTCKLCKSASTLLSNKGIVQEVERLKSIYRLNVLSCPNTALAPNKRKGIPDGRRYEKILKKVRYKAVEFTRLKPTCTNNDFDFLGYPDNYWLDSKNKKKARNSKGLPKIIHPDASGRYHGVHELVSQTFKCKKCHTKFSAPLNPQKGQTNQQINYQLFSELVNKGIINRIAEKLRINHDLIYSRIEFFYNQCIQFEQYQLKTNIHKLKRRTLNLSMDRQMFYSNWTSKRDARRTLLVNTSTVENESRFVFASTLNFDFTSDYMALSKEFIRIGEYSKEPYKRSYQQYILPEEGIVEDETIKTPTKHLLLKQTYSIFSHLEMLKPVFDRVSKINLYADDDNAFDMAITKVFKDYIKNGKLQACITRSSKLKKDGIEQYSALQWIPQNTPKIDGKYLDLKLLTEVDDSFLDQASLHGVDNYFQILRRRLNMLERPLKAALNSNQKQLIENDVSSSESKYEKWNIYGSYNPKYIAMMIEIMRVYNNYVLTDEKSIKNKKTCSSKPKTPAQKIGLVNNSFDIYDILEFSVARVVTDYLEQFKTASLLVNNG